MPDAQPDALASHCTGRRCLRTIMRHAGLYDGRDLAPRYEQTLALVQAGTATDMHVTSGWSNADVLDYAFILGHSGLRYDQSLGLDA